MDQYEDASGLVTVPVRADDTPGPRGKLGGTIFSSVCFLDRDQMWTLRDRQGV